jgi:hypothetical protein
MKMACKSAELTRDRAASVACKVFVSEEQNIRVMVFDPVIDICPKTWSGGLENVIF